MGEDTRIVVYARDKAAAQTACKAAFDRIAELDAMMSDYRKDSELMRLNDKAGGPPVHVSPDLYLVLKRAEKVSRLSGGEFDITVGPEVAQWRKARKTGVLPTAAEIKHAKGLVGWQRVVLNDRDETVKLCEARNAAGFRGHRKRICGRRSPKGAEGTRHHAGDGRYRRYRY